VQVGFNEGDGNRSYSLPQSRTKNIINIWTSSNVDQRGRWMYRVDFYDVGPPGCGRTGVQCKLRLM